VHSTTSTGGYGERYDLNALRDLVPSTPSHVPGPTVSYNYGDSASETMRENLRYCMAISGSKFIVPHNVVGAGELNTFLKLAVEDEKISAFLGKIENLVLQGNFRSTEINQFLNKSGPDAHYIDELIKKSPKLTHISFNGKQIESKDLPQTLVSNEREITVTVERMWHN
ncbi:MAG: hypothetical protein KBD37_02795, partial [Burkholderiales bacterium]|nr:hypothetical protein [Burkholderiales bacterium]